jgi:hypothetical protein
MWFDEHGDGYTPNQRLPSLTVVDPSGGVAGPVLLYLLPTTPTAGDVVLTEPGGSVWSDVIRFASVAGLGSVMIYYSNGDNGINLPANLTPNSVSIVEHVGSDFTPYMPMVNQPGFDHQSLGPLAFYGDNIAPSIPDATPTIGLLGIGLAGVVLLARTKT